MSRVPSILLERIVCVCEEHDETDEQQGGNCGFHHGASPYGFRGQ